jgi:hypothetical protein
MENLGQFKCARCGWVHVGISEAAAIAAVAEFNHHYETMNAETQASFKVQRATLDMYKRCTRCGETAETFVPALPGDAPLLATLQAVISPTNPSETNSQ